MKKTRMPPNISCETKKAMLNFFMKTSIPRIIKRMEFEKDTCK